MWTKRKGNGMEVYFYITRFSPLLLYPNGTPKKAFKINSMYDQTLMATHNHGFSLNLTFWKTLMSEKAFYLFYVVLWQWLQRVEMSKWHSNEIWWYRTVFKIKTLKENNKTGADHYFRTNCEKWHLSGVSMPQDHDAISGSRQNFIQSK